MENPCKTCIVRPNCTEVCPEKKNFKVYLNNAIKNYTNAPPSLLQNRTYHKQYVRYRILYDETFTDITKIQIRRNHIGREQN